MKLIRNGFIILLLISLAGTVLFYALRNNTQLRLNEQIEKSIELQREGVRLLEAGAYAQARESLLASLALNKLNGETFAHLADAEYHLGNYQSAYEYYMSAFNMEIISVDMVNRTARILLRSGHYAKAEKLLEDSLLQFPEQAELQDLLFELRSLSPGS